MNDVKDFRRCLGQFATGVTVVTCADEAGQACGITANSFSSVSLDPPLILWNIAKVTRSLDAYLQAAYFAVNILAQDQKELSNHFAQSVSGIFNGVEHTRSAEGVPLIPGAIATIECRTHDIHDCGDHYIIIGEVRKYQGGEGRPLLFFDGKYREIA